MITLLTSIADWISYVIGIITMVVPSQLLAFMSIAISVGVVLLILGR